MECLGILACVWTDKSSLLIGTFFVECAETAAILQNATVDSLVLLDELGRGTSTFDGYAIAYAVFRHLVEKVRCRLLFATHYHPLTKEFTSHPNVSLQHMACAFKPKNVNSLNGEMEPVFLYRLDPGACPESYGLQVAQMAGIPDNVVELKHQNFVSVFYYFSKIL
ncbi:DNA mismatch repair protein MSH7 [Acorus gramineus]|uniref:DNA mismatch repair protein MSH7 n=1 Tax=Acorus gramineus TaxID=55184 RepID=A0AAV9ACK3_ACOGR|nr:DNA mismatch repair protein MSH7 [Acorus gramineus]